jgi:hypothetical protein
MGVMVSLFDHNLNQNKTDYTDILDTINDGDYNVLHLKQKDELKFLVGNIVMNDDFINTPLFNNIEEVSNNHPSDIIFSDDNSTSDNNKELFNINDVEKKHIEQYINSDDELKPESSPCYIINEEEKHIPELVLNNSPKKKKNKKKKKKN